MPVVKTDTSLSQRTLPVGPTYVMGLSESWISNTIMEPRHLYITVSLDVIPNPKFYYFFTYYIHSNNNNCRWFMKINRKDAEKLIMNPVNPFGTFLVRTSETAEGGFV